MIRVERKSSQAVGWIHRCVCVCLCVVVCRFSGLLPKISAVTCLLVFSLHRQSDTLVPGMTSAFDLFDLPSFFILSTQSL